MLKEVCSFLFELPVFYVIIELHPRIIGRACVVQRRIWASEGRRRETDALSAECDIVGGDRSVAICQVALRHAKHQWCGPVPTSRDWDIFEKGRQVASKHWARTF